MDLSEAFDDLLIAKHYAYGSNKKSLKPLYNYLSNTWHKTKISKQFGL